MKDGGRMDDLIEAVVGTVEFVFRVLGGIVWAIASVGESILDATHIFGPGRVAANDSKRDDGEQA